MWKHKLGWTASYGREELRDYQTITCSPLLCFHSSNIKKAAARRPLGSAIGACRLAGQEGCEVQLPRRCHCFSSGFDRIWPETRRCRQTPPAAEESWGAHRGGRRSAAGRRPRHMRIAVLWLLPSYGVDDASYGCYPPPLPGRSGYSGNRRPRIPYRARRYEPPACRRRRAR